LSLGILFEIQSGSTSGPVLKIYCLKRMSYPGYSDFYRRLRNLGKDATQAALYYKYSWRNIAVQLSAVAQMSDQNLNIYAIKRLTGRVSVVEESFPFLRTIIRGGHYVDKSLMTASFMEISRTLNVDISFQEDNMYRRNRRLVCFDMDSTIQTEVIDELADRAGVGEQVRAITESAMNGEIDFSELQTTDGFT
jgi:phosphoserine phosphatase